MERRTENRLRQRKRALQHWYPAKRLAAFILSFAMIFANIGNSAAVAMAAEGNGGRVEFQMSREDVWAAAKEAVRAGGGISAENFNFTQGDAEGVRALFAGGRLFEITNGVKYEAYPDTEGAELRVFIRIPGDGDPENYQLTGEEKLVFMYMNSGEEDLRASVKIVGEESGEIAVNTGEILVESWQEAFGENHKEDEENLSGQTSAPAQGGQNGAGKEAAGSTDSAGSEETTAGAENAVGEETTAGEEVISGEETTVGEENAAGEETTVGEENAAGGETTVGAENTGGEETVAGEDGSVHDEAGADEAGSKTEIEIGTGTEAGSEEDADSTDSRTLDNAEVSGEETNKAEQDKDDKSSETGEEAKAETEVKPGSEAGAEASAEKSEASPEKAEAAPEHSNKDVKEPERADGAEEKTKEKTEGKTEEKSKDAEKASDKSADKDSSSDTSGSNGNDENKETAKLSKSENQVRVVAESAGDKYGLVALGENTTARVIVMKLSATGFAAEDEEEIPADVPEEVKKFLEAVAKLPEEITKENAEDVGALLYGEIADALEVLLGTEYEDRNDVQNAEVVMAEAIEMLEAVLGMETEVYAKNISVYANTLAEVKAAFKNQGIFQKTGASVTKDPTPQKILHVGEKNSQTFTPVRGIQCRTCGNWLGGGIFAPTKYCELEASDNNSLTKDFKFGKGNSSDSLAGSTECLKMDFSGAKPGTSTINVNYYCNFELYYDRSLGDDGGSYKSCYYCYVYYNLITNLGYVQNDATWHKYIETIPVKIQADYQLKYDLNGGSGSVPSTLKTAAATSMSINVTSQKPIRTDYTFKGWAEKPDAKAKDVISSVTLNWYEAEEDEYGNLPGSKKNPVTKILYAVWEEEDTSPDSPKATYTVIYTDGVSGEIVFPDEGYEGLQEGNNTPGFTGTTSRDGYTFMGWAPAVNPVVSADDANDKNEIIYTATWQKNEEKPTPTTYTVIYTDGVKGEIVFPDQGYEGLKVDDNTPAFVGETGEPSSPTRDGYTFKGWSPEVKEKVKADDANDKNEIIYTATWEKNGAKPTPKLVVTKKNDGFKVDNKTGKATVNYTVTVTNVSGFSIYGLRITDELDEPTLEKVNAADTGEPSITYSFKDFKIDKGDGNGPSEASLKSGGANDLIHILEPLDRNEEFKDNQKVTLTYTIEIENANDDVEVKVTLYNKVKGASWSKLSGTAPQGRKSRAAAMLLADAADRDEPDVDGEASSSTGGEISDSGSSDTEGTIPRKYRVSYTWNLPEGADEKLPETEKYFKDTLVTVDNDYTSSTKITVDGKTYTFSGWSTEDGEIRDAVENGEFTMPARNVVIKGTWTPDNPGPDKPDPDPDNPEPENPDPDKPDPDKPEPDNPGPDNPTPDNPKPDNPTPDIPNPETHKVTVHYIYADGSRAADDAVRDDLAEGTTYSITSPDISGYTPDQSIVNGMMGTEDVEITVTYTRNSSGNSGGGGSNGGGGGGGSRTTNIRGRVLGSTPDSEPDVPVAEVPDEDVPLANIPVNIPDADVPLAGIVQWNIPDDDVPLAAVPRTGDSSGVWHMMAILSAFGLIAMSLLDKKKRQE